VLGGHAAAGPGVTAAEEVEHGAEEDEHEKGERGGHEKGGVDGETGEAGVARAGEGHGEPGEEGDQECCNDGGGEVLGDQHPPYHDIDGDEGANEEHE